MANSPSWVESLSNPMGHIVKKYLSEVLQEKFFQHEDVVERISRSLVTRGDMENFGKLVLAIYEAGFMKAVEDNKEAWERFGVKPIIRESETATPPDPSKAIFNQKSQG